MKGKKIIVSQTVKENAVSEEGRKYSCSVEFMSALATHVEKTIKHAIERARQNGRTTLMARDI